MNTLADFLDGLRRAFPPATSVRWERCEHGVPKSHPCQWCTAIWETEMEEGRKVRRRREEIRTTLRALLPAPGTVVELCCRIYELRHSGELSRAADLALRPLIAGLLGPNDLEATIEVMALEIERAERRGYVRGACDERARSMCKLTSRRLARLSPGESRCDEKEARS